MNSELSNTLSFLYNLAEETAQEEMPKPKEDDIDPALLLTILVSLISSKPLEAVEQDLERYIELSLRIYKMLFGS